LNWIAVVKGIQNRGILPDQQFLKIFERRLRLQPANQEVIVDPTDYLGSVRRSELVVILVLTSREGTRQRSVTEYCPDSTEERRWLLVEQILFD
jgi:hypothetical protein